MFAEKYKNEERSECIFREMPIKEDGSREYRFILTMKWKWENRDALGTFGEGVHKGWSDEEGTVEFSSIWEGKAGDEIFADQNMKNLVNNLNSVPALAIEAEIMDDNSLPFIEKLARQKPEKLEIDIPIDKAISGNEIHKFINEAISQQWTSRIKITLRIASQAIIIRENNVRNFLHDLKPVNELLFRVLDKSWNYFPSLDEPCEIFYDRFIEELITTKKHNHVMIQNALDATFYSTLMNRVTEKSRLPVWNSVEFNVNYALLKAFLRGLSIPIDVADEQLKMDTSVINSGNNSRYYNVHLEESKVRIHCLFFKQDSGDMVILFNEEVIAPEDRDTRPLKANTFLVRIEKNVPKSWKWKEFIKDLI